MNEWLLFLLDAITCVIQCCFHSVNEFLSSGADHWIRKDVDTFPRQATCLADHYAYLPSLLAGDLKDFAVLEDIIVCSECAVLRRDLCSCGRDPDPRHSLVQLQGDIPRRRSLNFGRRRHKRCLGKERMLLSRQSRIKEKSSLHNRVMQKPSYATIVVKIGTNALLTPQNTLDEGAIARLMRQVASLMKNNVKVTIVSSGAMACGRNRLSRRKSAVESVGERQLLAAVGQVELMLNYRSAAQDHKLTVAQVLATKEDFRTRDHYANMRCCFDALLREGVIPIVNENDVVAVEELMFTDNDQLAGLVASMIGADALIILSNIDGVFDRPLGEKGAELIKTFHPAKDMNRIRIGHKSSFGRGGMQAKLETAKLLSAQGITTHIANAATADVLLRIQRGEAVGTTILPIRSHLSRTRRWLASSADHRCGSVTVDPGAGKALSADQPANLLPVGIRSLEGAFQKGDIVSVLDEKGTMIGLGMAAYGHSILAKCMGKRGYPSFIRADYFFPLAS